MPRPWKPLCWFMSRELEPGVDRITRIASEGHHGVILDRRYSYRLLWDEEIERWRFDARAESSSSSTTDQT